MALFRQEMPLRVLYNKHQESYIIAKHRLLHKYAPTVVYV